MSDVPKPLSKEEITRKVQELTKGSAFDIRKAEKQQAIDARVAEMKGRLAAATPVDRDRAQAMAAKAVEEAERHRILSRVMVHVDMDAFYASVEIRDRPELADKPVAVGGNSMLSTCNYVARTYGARSAMPGFVAKKLCPHLVIIPPDFRKYSAVAKQVRQVFAEYCPDFVSGGMDEAYLDITDYIESRLLDKVSNKIADFEVCENLSKRVGCQCDSVESSQPVDKGEALYCGKCKLLKCQVGETLSFSNSVWSVVEEIRFKILLKTQLTSSAGIAPNTMIAKIASDLRKPNGQFMVRSEPQEIRTLMETMAVAKVPFIGPVSQGELAGLDIFTCGDLRKRLPDLWQIFNEGHFDFFLRASLGIGSTQLEHGGPRKSIGTETTFEKTSDIKRLLDIINELCQEVAESLQEKQLCGRTVTLKMKTAEFRNFTRAGSCSSKNTCFHPDQKGQDLYQVAKAILEKEFADNRGKLSIRLLGIRISNLKDLSEVEESSNQSISALLGNTKFKPKCEDETSPKGAKAVKRPLPEEISLLDDDDTDSCQSVEVPDQDSEIQSFQCPICNFKFPRMTLIKFNVHIDECLNRSAIRSLKEEENLMALPSRQQSSSKPTLPARAGSNSNNRKSSSPPASKAPKQGQSSILKFLKPK